MVDMHLGVVEGRFADLIWENAPLSSTRLVALALEALEWKKSTTYTVLKRLCDKGIFVNEGGTVRAKLSREEYYSLQSRHYVDTAFQGSLPAFLAAFTSGKQLKPEEVEQLRHLVDSYQEE